MFWCNRCKIFIVGFKKIVPVCTGNKNKIQKRESHKVNQAKFILFQKNLHQKSLLARKTRTIKVDKMHGFLSYFFSFSFYFFLFYADFCVQIDFRDNSTQAVVLNCKSGSKKFKVYSGFNSSSNRKSRNRRSDSKV